MIQLVFLIGGFILAGALVPTVLAGGGPVLSTCLTTFGVLAAYTGAFMYMRQWVSAAGVAVSALLWLILAGQAL